MTVALFTLERDMTYIKHLLAVLSLAAGCQAAKPLPVSPVKKPAATPSFDDHCRECKQCSGGPFDENGEEQSLCEEGFRLMQEDLRKSAQ